MSDFLLNNSRTTMSIINIDIRCPYFRVSVIRDSTEGGNPWWREVFTLKSHLHQGFNNTRTGKILIAQVSSHLQKLSHAHPTSQDTPPSHSKAHVSIKLKTWQVVFSLDRANVMIVKLVHCNWKHALHHLYTHLWNILWSLALKEDIEPPPQ